VEAAAAAAAAAGIALKQFRRTMECVLGYRLKGCDTEAAQFMPSWDTMLHSTPVPPQQRPIHDLPGCFGSDCTSAICASGSLRPQSPMGPSWLMTAAAHASDVSGCAADGEALLLAGGVFRSAYDPQKVDQLLSREFKERKVPISPYPAPNASLNHTRTCRGQATLGDGASDANTPHAQRRARSASQSSTPPVCSVAF
jgi:hypothetical protein